MKKEIIAISRKYYCLEDFNYHIKPVVKNALFLAKKFHADREIVETAAYLHDIGRGRTRKGYKSENNHHITGAAEARKILKRLSCKKEFTEAVTHCILTHRGRKGMPPKTLEAKIIACADAMSHFDTFLDLFGFFLETCGSFEEAVSEIEAKMLRDWNKKLRFKEAKEMKREKYDAIMLLIKSMKEWAPKDSHQRFHYFQFFLNSAFVKRKKISRLEDYWKASGKRWLCKLQEFLISF